MDDQDNPKPPHVTLVYEDTGGLRPPLVYFDIIGAYGIMHGTVEIELATRILMPAANGLTDVKFLSARAVALQSDRRRQSAQRARCRAEDAGAAAAATRSGGGLQDELSGRARRHCAAGGISSRLPMAHFACQLDKRAQLRDVRFIKRTISPG